MGRIAKHNLRLGGVDLSKTKLRTIDLSHVNAGLIKAKARPIVGVIGADVLRRHKAVIDYGKGLLLLSPLGLAQERHANARKPMAGFS